MVATRYYILTMPKTKPKTRKERLFSKIHGFEIKESETGDLIRGGYIATTHLDSGFYDETREVWVRDSIAKESLDVWGDNINQGNSRANKVSVNHKRDKHVAGVGIKGSAHVDELPDGEYGLYADTFVDKTKENYEETKYRINNNLLDSYSIEFTTRNPVTGDYLDNAVVEKETDAGYIQRTLLPGTILEGWTLASQPMNEHAVMIKELNTLSGLNKINREVKNMTEPKLEVETKEQIREKVLKEIKEAKEAEDKVVADKVAMEEEVKKEIEEEAEKESKVRVEMKEKLKAELKAKLESKEVDNKTALNTEKEGKEIKPEFKEYKEMMKDMSKYSVEEQFKIAGKVADAKGMFKGDFKTETDVLQREYKFSTKEIKTTSNMINKIEFKSLGLTTNQNDDTDYLLSAAELQDVFDPVIYNVLNQKTTTWNLITKVDKSNSGNYQVQFSMKIARNATAGAYTNNAVSTGNVKRLKYQTKFKKYQVGVEVDGDMIAAARGGPIGDVFAQEVSDSTDDLMEVMNQSLFSEVGLETAAAVIGFEYFTDQAGNTTLYNLTRTQANGLASTTTTDNYINGESADISVTNLRTAKRKSVGVEGANLDNLIYVTSFIQGDKYRGIYDGSERHVPESSRFGFVGRPAFDGIPIFEDKDCEDDDWFLIDLETYKIAIWVPPTLEILGKDADSKKGFIKSYYATYSRAPRRMVQIYGNATS